MPPSQRSFAFAALVLAVPLALLVTVANAPRAIAAGKKAADKEEKIEPEPFGHYTVDQVARRLGHPNTYVFDGNTADVYAKNHLPGAVRLNHKDITPEVLPADKDAMLIFYCMNEH